MAIPWTTLVETVAAAITALSLVVAVFALWFSRRHHVDAINNFEKTLKVAYYAELDRMYFDLVAMRVGKPHLWGGSTKPTGKQAIEYEHYRFLVWNYLETVFDRCIAERDDKQEDDLRNTWEPALKF